MLPVETYKIRKHLLNPPSAKLRQNTEAIFKMYEQFISAIIITLITLFVNLCYI
jgi:hypothetical protein